MMFKKPFTPAEIEYIQQHLDEWPSVLAYKLSSLFGTPRTPRGVREQIYRIKAEFLTM
jgi:hypothetical protein